MTDELSRVIESIIEKKIKEVMKRVSTTDVHELIDRVGKLEEKVNKLYSLLLSAIPSYLKETETLKEVQRPKSEAIQIKVASEQRTTVPESSLEQSEDERVMMELVKELKRIEKEMNLLEEKRATGEISDEDYEKRKIDLEAKRKTLKELLGHE